MNMMIKTMEAMTTVIIAPTMCIMMWSDAEDDTEDEYDD